MLKGVLWRHAPLKQTLVGHAITHMLHAHDYPAFTVVDRAARAREEPGAIVVELRLASKPAPSMMDLLDAYQARCNTYLCLSIYLLGSRYQT